MCQRGNRGDIGAQSRIRMDIITSRIVENFWLFKGQDVGFIPADVLQNLADVGAISTLIGHDPIDDRFLLVAHYGLSFGVN